VNFELGTLIGLISTIVLAGIGYGKLQGRIDSQLEKVAALEKWKSDHEVDVATHRTVTDTRLTAFDVRLGRGEEKFEQISRDIGDIKQDLRTLLNRRRDDRPDEDHPKASLRRPST
jgi:hypothetical protein